MADVAALHSEPGIVVTHVDWKDDRAQLTGLRDPLAALPETVLAQHALPPASFALAPFVSLDPRIVERRAQGALEPPASAQVSVEGHDLHLAGAAPRAWIDDAKLLDRAIPGVEHVDDHALHSQESLDALHAAAAPLDALVITFRRGESRIDPDQEVALAHVADRARTALRAAADARVAACLVMTGHTDETGTEERNRSLSFERAAAVRARLASMGIDEANLRATGAGVLQTPAARSVSFHLDVDEARSVPGCGGAP
jgi:OOP family OmpA-OmpF porin